MITSDGAGGDGGQRRGALTGAVYASIASNSGKWPVSYLATREYCGVILQMHCSPSQLTNIKSVRTRLNTVYHGHSRPSPSATDINTAREKSLTFRIVSEARDIS